MTEASLLLPRPSLSSSPADFVLSLQSPPKARTLFTFLPSPASRSIPGYLSCHLTEPSDPQETRAGLQAPSDLGLLNFSHPANNSWTNSTTFPVLLRTECRAQVGKGQSSRLAAPPTTAAQITRLQRLTSEWSPPLSHQFLTSGDL